MEAKMKEAKAQKLAEKEKREATREAHRRTALAQMKRVRCQYEKVLTEYEAATGSRGLVAAWGRVGGSGNRITQPTQERALSAIAMEEHRQAMLKWFESIRDTCNRLKARGDKSPALWRRHWTLERALRLYVFERADAELIALVLGTPKQLSRKRVIAILGEAALEVAIDAEKAGLFDEDETARDGAARPAP